MTQPIQFSAAPIDLSGRFAYSDTVVASPALAAETVVGQVVIPDTAAIVSGVWLTGAVAWTVGTSGTASTIRLRETGVAGTLVASTGAVTTAAASLRYHSLYAVDSAGTPGMTYVVTLQVANGAAASTVSYVFLGAILV